MKKIWLYILYFFIFSIFGWIWEELLYYVRHGFFINCGTLYGPWLPIYGWGSVFVLLLHSKVKEKPILFLILSFIICGVIEYLTSLYLEVVHHMMWWDYSNYTLTINNRVWLVGLLIFSLFSFVIAYIISPIINKLYKKMNKKILKVILIILLMFHVGDYIYSTINPNTSHVKIIKNE